MQQRLLVAAATADPSPAFQSLSLPKLLHETDVEFEI